MFPFAPHISGRWIKPFVFTGLLAILLGNPHAVAETSARIKKMAYAELNQRITRKSGHHMLIFMAAWCRPCKEALPTLNRLYHHFNGRGIQFTGISVDAGGPAAMERVLKKNRVDFPVYWVGETAIDELNIAGIPMIFFVKNGRIVDKIPGKCSYAFLEARILDFIK